MRIQITFDDRSIVLSKDDYFTY